MFENIDETKTRKRVLRGAAWLDLTVPKWYEKIDLDRLDMGKSEIPTPSHRQPQHCGCVCAQLDAASFEAEGLADVGSFWNFIRTRGWDQSAIDCGFVAGGDEYGPDTHILQFYKLLTLLWVEQIESRRAHA